MKTPSEARAAGLVWIRPLNGRGGFLVSKSDSEAVIDRIIADLTSNHGEMFIDPETAGPEMKAAWLDWRESLQPERVGE